MFSGKRIFRGTDGKRMMQSICVFGAVAGEFRKSTSDAEEIVPGWYTKEEIRELLRTEAFAARTQAYCYAWANS